jgi:hypothetical protein
MAITSRGQLINSLLPAGVYYKEESAYPTSGNMWMTSFYTGGYPVAASAPLVGLSGVALTSYTGQYPFTNPASGNTYLSSVRKPCYDTPTKSSQQSILLVDRLWHNSGLDRTSITAQAVNSVTWPARDLNGSSDGVGVYIAIEVTTATGSGSPVVTMTYTNSSGASGKSATAVNTITASGYVGRWFPLGLAEGDIGVRSIQDITFSASWGATGALSLVAYRPIAIINATRSPLGGNYDDALSLAMPKMWNNTVLQSITIPSTSFAPDGGPIMIQQAQG